MTTDARQIDRIVRTRAFDWLEQQTRLHGDVLPRKLLLQGFEFEGHRVPLVSAAQGIFKPAVMPRWPLSILSSPEGPYDDGFLDEHHLLYRYRGTDPHHRDNVGLREAMELRLPLLYLFRIAAGRYLTVWPVFIVSDNEEPCSTHVHGPCLNRAGVSILNLHTQCDCARHPWPGTAPDRRGAAVHPRTLQGGTR